MATKKKKAPAKIVRAKRAPKQAEFSPKSFEIAEGPRPFVQFKITRQTIYWLILLAVISALTLWILKLQLDIMDILNSPNFVK